MEPEEYAYTSQYGSCWNYMSDPMLLNIFQYLSAKELLDAGLTCRLWNRISYDELLWKHLFYRDHKVDPAVGIIPGIFMLLH